MSSRSWRSPGTSLKSQKRSLGSPAAQPAQAAPSDREESAEPAKSEEVCSAVRHLRTSQSSCASGSAMPPLSTAWLYLVQGP